MTHDDSPQTRRAFPTRLFCFVFLGWTFDFYDLVLLGFLKGPIARDLGLGASGEAWLLGVALGFSGLGGIVAGFFADRLGKRTVLAATILMYSVGSLVCGASPNVAVFIFGRAIVGLGVGGEWAIGHALLAESVPDALRGRASAALQSGEPVGVAIAAVAGYVIAPCLGDHGWRWVMMGSCATGALAFFLRQSAHISNERAASRVPLILFRQPGVRRRMATAWVLGVLKLGTYWTCYTWLPTFLLVQMKQGVGRSLTWVLTAQAGQLVGMLSFGVVADRVGRRPAFCIFSLLTACGLAPLAYRWSVLSLHPFAFWSAMLVLGFGSGCTAGFGALLAELFPSEIRATAMGTTYNLARAAQLAAPVLVGWAVAERGLAAGLTVPLVFAILTASWVWMLPETRGIRLPSAMASS